MATYTLSSKPVRCGDVDGKPAWLVIGTADIGDGKTYDLSTGAESTGKLGGLTVAADSDVELHDAIVDRVAAIAAPPASRYEPKIETGQAIDAAKIAGSGR